MHIIRQDQENRKSVNLAAKFLENLFGDAAAGYLSLWRGDSRLSSHFALPGDFKDIAERGVAVSEEADVYFALGLRRKNLGPRKRGAADDVCALPGFWLDLDVVGPGHEKDKLPQNFDEALEFLEELPLEPSYIVHSGGGLHVYWLFRELWTFDSAKEREEAASASEGWQNFIVERGRFKGWDLDDTKDLARVLRLPGTLNRKPQLPQPQPVYILRATGTRFNPSDFEACQMKPTQQKTRAKKVEEVIPSGERNNQLASLAGTMRRRGMGVDEILAALRETNRKRCQPPLPDREVAAIAKSIAKYDVKKPSGAHAAAVKDMAHAEVLAAKWLNRFRWGDHRGKWYAYNRGVWQDVPEQFVAKNASDVLRKHYATLIAGTTDSDALKELSALVREVCTYRSIMNALNFLKGWSGFLTFAEDWDADPYLLNVKNGTLHLKTGILQPHRAEDLLTKQVQADYDPDFEGPMFKRHLDYFLPDLEIRRQVQRDLGVGLVGATLQEFLPFWYGSGANGKTTTLRAILEVLGGYGLRAAPNLLIQSKHERHPAEVADLMGSRVVFSVEVDQGKQLAEALVKDLTGGDRKKARFMRQDWFEFEQTFTMFLVVNHKPAISGVDHAIWRRVRLIPWGETLPQAQRRPQEEVVGELVAEGSAILNWMLEGLQDWQNNRHWLAPAVQAATDEYRAQQDRLRTFLDDCCEIGPHFTVTVAELYDAYTRWCDTAGEEALGKGDFGNRLRERGLSTRRGAKGARAWSGIRLVVFPF